MTDILAPGVGYTTFRQLFTPSEDRRVKLSVPDYQRSYDWRSEHRKDLFTDLERLDELSESGRLKDRSGHFCGTVICTPVTTRGANLQYDVVDGQQRMTTLVLLHGQLARAAGETSFVVSGPNSLFVPQQADADYFRGAVRDDIHGEPNTVGQQRYKTAVDEIKSWIAELGEARAARMLHLVEDRLQFIFFVLEDSNEVSKVFETINNRGKPLTQLDLVKNHLIYMQAVHGWDGSVDAVWTRVQQLAVGIRFRGGEGVDTVLRAVVTAMFHPGQRDAGSTDHKIVKKHIHAVEHGDTFERFLRFLETGFQAFHDLRNAYDTGKDEPVRTQLAYLNQHPSISGVLPLILARQFCRKDDQGADVLVAIEKANFRLYGLMNASKKSNSHHVPLHKLAHRYFTENCQTGGSRSTDERRALSVTLIADLTKIVTDQHKDGFGQIVRALTLDDDDGADFYHWEGLRYFLARWEESLMDKQSFEYRRLDRRFHTSHSNSTSRRTEEGVTDQRVGHHRR